MLNIVYEIKQCQREEDKTQQIVFDDLAVIFVNHVKFIRRATTIFDMKLSVIITEANPFRHSICYYKSNYWLPFSSLSTFFFRLVTHLPSCSFDIK